MSDQHVPSGGYGAPTGYQPPTHDPYAPQGNGYPQSGWAPGTGPQGPQGPHGHGGGPGGPQKPSNNLPIIVAIAVLAVVAIAAIAFVVLGQDDGDDDTSADGDEPTDQAAPPPADVSLADIEPALLTASDVPAGYEQVEWVPESSDEQLGAEDIDASDECKEAFGRLAGADDAREETGSEFESAADGGSITHTLSLAVEGDVTLAEVGEATSSCGTFTYTDGDQAGEITLSSEPVDGLGTEALGVTMLVSAESEGVPVSLEMYGIMWDRDGVHSSVQFTGGLDMANYTEGGPIEGLPADRDAVFEAAQLVDGRIQEALAS